MKIAKRVEYPEGRSPSVLPRGWYALDQNKCNGYDGTQLRIISRSLLLLALRVQVI